MHYHEGNAFQSSPNRETLKSEGDELFVPQPVVTDLPRDALRDIALNDAISFFHLLNNI